MMKRFGYYLFAFVYLLCKPIPIKKKRVLCIMTHDDGESSNVSLAARALKNREEGYTFSYITKKDTGEVKSFAGLRTMLSFFFRKPYELARAEIILLDNIFLPFAYLKTKKKTKVVQLWHGTGTIKKFGQDVNTGKLKELEKRANSNITHLIVNSPKIKRLYAGAFGVKEKNIYVIGLPKTDELLLRIKKAKVAMKNPDKEYIYQKYHIPANKKLVLYAPTFRDREEENPRLIELIRKLSQELTDEYYLGLRLHPYIANSFREEQMDERVIQLSFEKDLNTLLLASDLLVTDYSSIIFEYSLLKRPMIFLAYDYKDFSDIGRGFYYNYESFVPGPVVYNYKEAAQVIQKNTYDYHRIEEFISNHYMYTDGNATDRLIELLKQ